MIYIINVRVNPSSSYSSPGLWLKALSGVHTGSAHTVPSIRAYALPGSGQSLRGGTVMGEGAARIKLGGGRKLYWETPLKRVKVHGPALMILCLRRETDEQTTLCIETQRNNRISGGKALY